MDEELRAELQDALWHLQNAFDREITLGLGHDPRMDEAIANIRSYYGAGQNTYRSTGQPVSVGDHSEPEE